MIATVFITVLVLKFRVMSVAHQVWDSILHFCFVIGLTILKIVNKVTCVTRPSINYVCTCGLSELFFLIFSIPPFTYALGGDQKREENSLCDTHMDAPKHMPHAKCSAAFKR